MIVTLTFDLDDDLIEQIQEDWLSVEESLALTPDQLKEALKLALQDFQEDTQYSLFDAFTHYAPSNEGVFLKHLIEAATKIRRIAER
jgi:hypothetical protein